MDISKANTIKITDTIIIVFLCIHVFGSQISVALSSVGLGGMIILAVFRLIMDSNVYKPEKNLIYVFLLFVFAQLTASIFSINPLDSFIHSKRVFLFSGFFITIIFIKDIKQLRIILSVFFIITALVSIYELVRYFISFEEQSKIPIGEYRIGYFGYPITNAEIKMLILLIIISLILLKDRFIFNKVWLSLIAVPIFLSLFFTNSRNALLGLFTGLLYIGYAKNKYFLAGLIIVVVLFLVFAPMPIKERVMSITDMNHPSNLARFETWKTGIKMIEDHPIFGIGDTDILKLYRTYKIPEFQGEGSHMHNNVLNVFLTLGIFGLLCWIVMMVYLFIRLIKIYYLTKSSPVLNIFAVTSISAFIAFQVSGLTEWNFGDFEFTAVLWFTLGLSFLSEKFFKIQADTRA
jgi:putative inorganic carbon (HCO3(-)) transporter